jgi:hypothetical protein
MDYARFNYVAQPEDEGAGLMPVIGPYDVWSIIYGYKLLPDAGRFAPRPSGLPSTSGSRSGPAIPSTATAKQQGRVIDPSAQTEDLSSDAVLASDAGHRQPQAHHRRAHRTGAVEDEKDYSPNCKSCMARSIGQLRRYTGHVGNNVGGVWKKSKTADEEGVIYNHVPKGRQIAAVEFLNQQIFKTPAWLINTEILARIQPAGAVDNIRSLQEYALGLLFQGNRLNRVIENEALNGTAAYSVKNLFDDTRQGIFQEVYQGKTIDPYRRNLQRAYIAQMGSLMQLSASQHDRSDIKAMARGTLDALKADIRKKARGQKDDATRFHLQDLLARIEMIEEGKMPAPAAPTASPSAFEHMHGPSCWE